MEEEQHDQNAVSSKSLDDNAERGDDDYENIECNEEKVQPITGSILLNSLRTGPIAPTEAPSGAAAITAGSSKGKRRSKNVVEGRVFKCQHCEKTYLSYPALYTHMKTKHAVPLSDTQAATGRSRGRPKKPKPAVKDADPSSFEYFSGGDRGGETLDPVLRFSEAFEELKGALTAYPNVQAYPLFSKIGQRILSENITNCDEIFAKYLSEVAPRTNDGYFKMVAKFVILYRECLNKYGWLKLFENIAPQIETEEEKAHPAEPKQTEANTPKVTRQILLTGDQVEKMREEYSVANNAEFLPEVANEFVMVFLPEHPAAGMETKECMNLVVNMAEWMFANGFTCTKVSLMKK